MKCSKIIIFGIIGFILLSVSCKESKIDEAEIQQLLDNGSETPFTILAAGFSMEELYGKTYKGGLIFYLNANNETGMVAAEIDQESSPWGCWQLLSDPIAEGIDIGTGIQNSISILSNCDESEISARFCTGLIHNAKEDWFLPSKEELNLMYVNLYLKGYGNFRDGSMSSNYYWTSTDTEVNRAWRQSFNSGIQSFGSKRNYQAVRAVRNF